MNKYKNMMAFNIQHVSNEKTNNNRNQKKITQKKNKCSKGEGSVKGQNKNINYAVITR